MNHFARPHSIHTKEWGFSLFEVIIVLVILGIVTAMVLPNVGKVSSGIIKSQAIKNVNSAFYMASSIAASTGNPVKLKFDIGQKKIEINHSKTRKLSQNFDEEIPQGSIFDDLHEFKIADEVILNPNVFYDSFDPKFEYSFYPNGEAAGPQLSLLIEDSLILNIDVDRLTGKPLITTDEN